MSRYSIVANHRLQHVSWAFSLLGLFVLAGCGNPADSGPERFALKGKVTFGGQPVVYGTMMIEPDRDKGNSGPSTRVMIDDGAYDTSANNAKGSISGPMVVHITGYESKTSDDPEKGPKTLFEDYTTNVTIEGTNEALNFDVPADAAKSK